MRSTIVRRESIQYVVGIEWEPEGKRGKRKFHGALILIKEELSIDLRARTIGSVYLYFAIYYRWQLAPRQQ